MAGRQERVQLAARYEVWRSVVQVQRWWRTIKGRHAQVDPKTIKNCHEKLITTGSVADTRRSGRPSKSRDPEVEQVFKKRLPVVRKSQFDKQQGKMGSSFTVYEMCSKMSLNGVLGSRTTCTVKHSLPETATIVRSLER